MAETPSTHHVIRVRFDGGPRHGRTVDLLITGQLPLMLTAGSGPGGDASSGLYQLRSTEGGGTRYDWIDDLPARS
ncbi:hypothetical protein SAMN06297387_109105 [Streptomyces zhaozhouensis]|uniref:Uncharacterized protein n=1 Tax=Streptomyces zhaozhouensis TaxID=1300267 RepID=A0A286DX02_9ACTN|nr:hypothetical protein [Streptomyces zhaozhouensis]SOD63163.1 hypothetical protein SAMN06297387_109105 [Streptomyces zhaozhouensis]